jgi:hypothetical protein
MIGRQLEFAEIEPQAGRASECPPALPFVLAVGVTGHRKEALPPDSLPSLNKRLRAVLEELLEQAQKVRSANRQFFSNDPPRFLFVSPLADGADQIAAEIALELGYELHALLPFERERYLADMPDDESRAGYNSLLSRSACILELPGESSQHLESYVMAGRATIAHCDLLVAVWDGLPPRGRGGTGEVVRLAHDRAKPTIHVPVSRSEQVTLRWGAFDPAVVTHPQDPANVRGFGAEELEDVLTALLSPPPDDQERSFIRKFQAECRRKIRARIEYPLLLAAAGVSRIRRDHWRADLAATRTHAEWRNYCDACERVPAVSAPLTTLQDWYEWADSLASDFAQFYRSGHVFNFVLAALAVIFALVALVAKAAKPYLAVAEFLAVLAILVNTSVGIRQQWRRRWLDYRQLAERLRPMRSLKLLGVAAPDPPGTAANPVPRRWIDWYAATVWRAIGCPSGRIDAARMKRLAETIVEHEIAPQVAYHQSTARQAHRLDHRLELLGYGLFAATLLAIVTLLILLAVDHHLVAEWIGWFTLFTAGFPAIGTAVFGIRVQGDYVGGAIRSEQTAQVLEQIAERLKRDPANLSRAGDLVEQAARAMHADLDEWRLLNQQHDLSVG